MIGFLSSLFAQVTLSQVIAATPQIIKLVQAVIAVYQELSKDMPHEQALSKSAELGGKGLISLLAPMAGVSIPIPHKMTPEEEERLFQRAVGIH